MNDRNDDVRDIVVENAFTSENATAKLIDTIKFRSGFILNAASLEGIMISLAMRFCDVCY